MACVNVVFISSIYNRYSHSLQGDPFYRTTQRLGADGVNVIFVSPTIEAEVGRAEEYHLDGTFKTVPRLFYQLFTVHLVSFDRVSMKYSIN